MITWRKIKETLDTIDSGRLDDPAVVDIDSELVQFDILLVDVPEIGDDRLVGYLVRGHSKTIENYSMDCPYCGGACCRELDGCDGYIGDIDGLLRDDPEYDGP